LFALIKTQRQADVEILQGSFPTRIADLHDASLTPRVDPENLAGKSRLAMEVYRWKIFS
jgi:hypothetical protein